MTKLRSRIALASIIAVGAAVRLVGLGAKPFWLDEAHSAEFTRLPLSKLWSFSHPFDTVNPPGYILFLKVWAQLGRSDAWLRLPSALAGIVTVWVVYLIGARMGNRRVGLIASTFLAVAGYHVRYSQEARAYALITLCAAVAMLSMAQMIAEPDGDVAARVRRRSRPPKTSGQGLRRPITWTDASWFGYAASVGIALHLHNTAIGIPLAGNIAMLVWWLRTAPRPPRFVRNWVAANIGAVLVWSPWLPGFLSQLGLVQANFWVPQPTIGSVVSGLAELFNGYVVNLVPASGGQGFDAATLAGYAVIIVVGLGKMKAGFRPLVLAFLLTQPIFELAFSLRQPVFLSRTLLWLLVPAAIAVASALAPLRGVRLGAGCLLVLAVPALGTFGYHLDFQKTAWDQAAAWVATEAGPDDVVFVLAGNTTVAFDHYYDGPPLDEFGLPWDLPLRRSRGAVLSPSDIDQIQDIALAHPQAWLVLNSVGNIENSGNLAPALAAVAGDQERRKFPDVTVIRYEIRAGS